MSDGCKFSFRWNAESRGCGLNKMIQCSGIDKEKKDCPVWALVAAMLRSG